MRFIPHTLNILNSALVSTIRVWRGTREHTVGEAPQQMLELFDQEGSARCRLVREVLTELNFDAMIYPCPKAGSRYIERLKELSGDDKVPFLHDPNTGAKLSGAQEIADYLFFEYTGQQPPPSLTESAFNLVSSTLASQLRFNQGTSATPSKGAEQPMVLYSFESSPFSRLVRERLCELELPYQLINLSKQQWADMGPAGFRMHLGEYQPVPGSKRESFLNEHGDVQVPFLIDPNTEAELFESKQILRYLNETYAQ